MRIDPQAHARRLVGALTAELVEQLAADPLQAVGAIDGLEVSFRPPTSSGGCALDGTYAPLRGGGALITVADDASPARQRFTVLHEFGHHLVYRDAELADLDVPDSDRRDEEICNEVATSLLIPAVVVASVLTRSHVTAEEIALLHAKVGASRAACCVSGARHLGHPGSVVLSYDGVTVNFAARHPSTRWSIARGSEQVERTLLARAGRYGHARGVTDVHFASGKVKTGLQADAFRADDGWLYLVLVEDSHSPWTAKLNFANSDDRAPTEVVECGRCDVVFTAYWARCPSCGDHRCPSCKRCSCRTAPRAEQTCPSCFLTKPSAQFRTPAGVCVDCE